MDQEKLEAPPGFEPGMEVLQTSALPLGDGADQNCAARSKPDTTFPSLLWDGISDSARRTGSQTRTLGSQTQTVMCSRRSRHRDPRSREHARRRDLALQKWSGKRDSNPRLRPWQGRTLPLSYSRPQPTKVPHAPTAGKVRASRYFLALRSTSAASSGPVGLM